MQIKTIKLNNLNIKTNSLWSINSCFVDFDLNEQNCESARVICFSLPSEQTAGTILKETPYSYYVDRKANIFDIHRTF